MTPNTISNWLQNPYTVISEQDIKTLLTKYPYFVPARYMQAAQNFKNNPLEPADIYFTTLYSGNKVLLYDLLNRSLQPIVAQEPTPKFEHIEETIVDEYKEAPITDSLIEKDVIDLAEIIEIPSTKETIDLPNTDITTAQEEEMKDLIIEPVSAEDYFRHQGITVADELPASNTLLDTTENTTSKDPKSLMVMMSFSEWLTHYRNKNQQEKEDEEERRAIKTMWQKEKLAAALGEEDDEIPEEVFEMAVHSLDKDEALVSESLAEILTKQGKITKAIEMYQKLSLRNPQKSTYFAQQIRTLQNRLES